MGGDALLDEVRNVEALIELHQRKAALLRDVRARFLSGQLCVPRIRRASAACRDVRPWAAQDEGGGASRGVCAAPRDAWAPTGG